METLVCASSQHFFLISFPFSKWQSWENMRLGNIFFSLSLFFASFFFLSEPCLSYGKLSSLWWMLIVYNYTLVCPWFFRMLLQILDRETQNNIEVFFFFSFSLIQEIDHCLTVGTRFTYIGNHMIICQVRSI